ncbi:MAG: small multi-drug export protein [Bacillota bacterium]
MYHLLDQLPEVILYSIWDVRIGVTVAVVNDFRPVWALTVGTSSSIAAVIPSYGLLRQLLQWSRRYLPRARASLLRLTQRHHASIERYGYLGIFLLVAVPLPGTGPWTGALCASLLRMDPVRASMALAGGIMVAGLLSLGITEGILSLLPFFS